MLGTQPLGASGPVQATLGAGRPEPVIREVTPYQGRDEQMDRCQPMKRDTELDTWVWNQSGQGRPRHGSDRTAEPGTVK